MICDLVRDTCTRVAKKAKDVKIDVTRLLEFCQEISQKPVYVKYFDCPDHISIEESEENIAAYVFIMDALNFCFWPSSWEYADLSKAISKAIQKDANFGKPENLAKLSLDQFKSEVFEGLDFPLMEERHRAVVEIGKVTQEYFKGSFLEIIKSVDYDAPKLLDLIARFFLKFQDHSIYEGEQIFFYKRGQILVGDLYGAFDQKQGETQIKNVDRLTCFADYRIPQILRHKGVLVYSENLKKMIDGKIELIHGCPEEVEIRACMVHAVELMRDELRKAGVNWTAVEVDWLLWQVGEEMRHDIPPHHRTLSIYY